MLSWRKIKYRMPHFIWLFDRSVREIFKANRWRRQDDKQLQSGPVSTQCSHMHERAQTKLFRIVLKHYSASQSGWLHNQLCFVHATRDENGRSTSFFFRTQITKKGIWMDLHLICYCLMPLLLSVLPLRSCLFISRYEKIRLHDFQCLELWPQIFQCNAIPILSVRI